MSTDTIVVPTSKSSLHSVWLLGGVVALIVASRIIAFLDDPEVWLDEAMLMANLPLQSVSDAFRPLPEHAQAAPPGYLLVASGIAWLFGDHQHHGLRLLSIAGSLGAMVFMLLALLRLNAATLAPIALALVFLSPFGVRYAIEIKQYSFDIMATSLLLYATIRAAQRGGRLPDLVILAGAGIFAILFSFSAPLLIAGMTAGLAAAARWKRPFTVAAHSPVFLMVGLTLFAALWHFTVTSYITAENFSVWAAHYTNAYLALPFLQGGEGISPLGFLSIMFGMFDPWYRMSSGYYAQRIVAVICTLLLAVGFFAGARRIPFVAWSCVAFLGGIAALSVLGLYPIIYTRHFTFVQPVVGIVIAAGFAVLGSCFMQLPLGRQVAANIRMGLATLLIAALGYSALKAALSQEKSHLRQAITVVETATQGNGGLIYVSGAAGITLPFVDAAFAAKTTPGPVDMPKQAQSAAENDMIWFIFSPVYEDELPQVMERLEPFRTAFGQCNELSRAGSDADLGYTIAYRCGPRAP